MGYCVPRPTPPIIALALAWILGLSTEVRADPPHNSSTETYDAEVEESAQRLAPEMDVAESIESLQRQLDGLRSQLQHPEYYSVTTEVGTEPTAFDASVGEPLANESTVSQWPTLKLNGVFQADVGFFHHIRK